MPDLDPRLDPGLDLDRIEAWAAQDTPFGVELREALVPELCAEVRRSHKITEPLEMTDWLRRVGEVKQWDTLRVVQFATELALAERATLNARKDNQGNQPVKSHLTHLKPDIEYHWKHDGWLRVDTRTGASRYLTWWETIKLAVGLRP